MTFDCRELDDMLRDGEPEAMAAARAHAAGCAACRERLGVWDEVSEAAPSLRKDWASPGLWPAIEARLVSEKHRPRLVARLERWQPLAMAASVALVVAAGALFVLRQRETQPPIERAELERRLLTEKVVAAVERSEAEYIASIDQLAKLAAPLLEKPASPLLSSYREKLQILDAAIADCRAQIERNRFNAHLRGELLSIYREKQRTLQMLMEEKS